MKLDENDYLAHYGILRRSGRYPWGSGGHNETQRSKHFLDYVADLKSQGLSEKEIAQGFEMSLNQLRASRSIAINQQRMANIALAQRLKDKGYSTTAISKRMNEPEPTVRTWLLPGAADKANVITSTANVLKKHVDNKQYLDIGSGNENYLGVSKTRLDTAVEVLKQQGYVVHLIKAPQVTGGHRTNMKILTPPGTTRSDVYKNMDKIQQIKSFSDDGGRTYGALHPPLVINPNRVAVVYREDGGAKSDGMIFVRRNVDDISIGGAKYAQVRVAVGDDHYLKGMAIYKDDMPDGADIEFHTSKSFTGNKLDAMKKNTSEKGYVPDGPHVLLKSVKRQILADPGTPNERVTSAMNIVNEEGAWQQWSRSMASQMLSKQKPALAKAQLNMTYEGRQNEFENINSLTNPTVKKKLLDDFADSTDAAAVHLQAAALPRTGNHIILPLSSIKPTEVYAPQMNHGEKVVLIRHPHGGPFEIPELTVNNRNKEGRSLLGQSVDAIGIHHSVAQRMSGADFDGDTVLVIPNNRGKVITAKPLDGLKDFDPRSAYPGYPGMKIMSNTQRQIGEISNLITDMSLREASHEELARALRHSMVVIDAEKHGLNYRLSANDNGIKQLKKKYQSGGASTLISRAKSPVRLPEMKPRSRPKGGPIDLNTGEKKFEPTGRRNASGDLVRPPLKRLSITSDAHDIKSTPIGTPMERIYADHSNKLKALANKARLASVRTKPTKMSDSAKRTYAPQVVSLKQKLDIAQRNRPLERQAQLIAGANVKARKDANPHMDPETEKKISYQALIEARNRTGAQKHRVKISDEEWNAIQAGAISHSQLVEILKHADMNVVRQHALPKKPLKMTTTKTIRARQMLDDGYSREYLAEFFGVSLSTLDKAVKG